MAMTKQPDDALEVFRAMLNPPPEVIAYYVQEYLRLNKEDAVLEKKRKENDRD